MKYINKIKSIISNIYNNIAYIALNDVKKVHRDKINELNKTIDKRVSFIECDVNDLLSDVSDLMDYETLERHDVESIIIDEIGYKENLASYEDMIYQRDMINNKIKVLKEDIEHCIKYNRRLNLQMKDIEENYKVSVQPYEENYFQFLVDEVIKRIVNKLEINENV